MSVTTKAIWLAVAIVAGSTWACAFVVFAILAFAMRGLADEPGRPASTGGAMVVSAVLFAFAAAGGLVAYWAFRRLRRMNAGHELQRGSEVSDGMFDRNTPINAFLAAAAAKQPAPGGGSVAALTGALAASMGEMVLNYSVGKKGLEPHQDELKEVLQELTRVRELMLGLMEEDQVAYAALTEAKKLPEGSPERNDQFPAALVASIRTPQAVGAAALAMLELAERVLPKVNKWLLSDLAVCVDLATATVRSAVYNIRANLPDIANPTERASTDWAAVQMLGKAIDTAKRVGPAIWARHAEPKV